MIEIDEEILAVFIDDAADLLQTWETVCLEFRRSAGKFDIDQIYRIAHNLKGSSRSVGLKEFGDFVHQVENLLTPIKKGQLEPSEKVITFLLDCQSFLSAWVEELKSDPRHVRDCSILLAEIPKLHIATHKKQEEYKDFGTLLVEEGAASPDQIKEAIALQNRKLGDIMVEEGMITPQTVNKILEKQKKITGGKRRESIRVSAEKIDKLIRLVGELTIHQSIVHHGQQTETLDSTDCQKAISLSQKLIKEVQTLSLSLRMHPLRNLFQRLERVAGDISGMQDKGLKIELTGSTVEIDKSVIENVTDPLTHIVRNAVDHGIETKEERKQAEKDVPPIIRIGARQNAAGVTISVSDNGRGLNRELIRKRAIQMQLLREDEKINDDELWAMIWTPGFTTADKVTELSGRGVGMDVVKQAVDSVGGSISIRTLQGKGTTFDISLPTSVNIIDAFVIAVEGQRYLIPMQDLDETIDLNDFEFERSDSKRPMINLRGQIVPIEKIRDFFPIQLEKAHKPIVQSKRRRKERPAIIVSCRGAKVAFAVDSILGQQQVVNQPLNAQLANLPGYSGCTILSDGEPGLIVALKSITDEILTKHRRKDLAS